MELIGLFYHFIHITEILFFIFIIGLCIVGSLLIPTYILTESNNIYMKTLAIFWFFLDFCFMLALFTYKD
jgi:hypothetical protein